MAKTLDERIVQLENAHSRLFNRFNKLEEDYQKLQELMFEKHLPEIYNKFKSLNSQPIEYKIGAQYSGIIKEIISKSEPVSWKNNSYINYELKLDTNKEIFTAFVQQKYLLNPGTNIKFVYLDNFKLSQIRIY
jgi:hypothetical protein